MKQLLAQINWVDLGYKVAGTILATGVLKWFGFFRKLGLLYRERKARISYKRILKDECSTLIVIGRRKGFAIDDVFIPLDIAPSDLMAKVDEKKRESRAYPSGSYILVGGPGAGKSTLAKREVLDRLSNHGRHLPLFIRLREYVGHDSIEHCLLSKLKHASFPAPENVLQRELSSGVCFCVLDGLDEVRPQLRDKVCRDINHFYTTHFAGNELSKLIVTCRKEAYRGIPLDIPQIWEVRPLTDEQIRRFAERWPPKYPHGKSANSFLRDLEASPRIHELARSPLLLVGGLTQYTESNLGIPEERFEYLSRVAKWLVSDWALAQSHPADPYRSVYDRVLARLAFHMHKSQRPDLERSEAVELLRQWLPTFGLKAEDADTVLERIGTKTGILINQAQNTIVFAQFGLQEYFASLEALQQCGLDAFVKLQPKDWWREVVLLTAAQQREPTVLLDKLFIEDALLASACVAECPTPPIALQKRAMESCLKGVDAHQSGAAGALVPLLRKLKDQQEHEFCSELERRLQGDKDRSSIVGIALATAGTERATTALARHPEVWEACLKNAGYLSSSFEHMLVGWIQEGDETQSGRAAELIASRLSADRFRQLLDILATLKENRAEKLAGLLLRHIESRIEERYPGPIYAEEWSLSILGRCVPFIRNREKYLFTRYHSKRPHARRFYDDADATATSLFLDSNGKRFDAERLQRYLLGCLTWARSRGALLLWLASGISLLLPSLPGPLRKYFLVMPVTLLILSANKPNGTLPWMRRFGWSTHPTLPVICGVFLAGVCVVLTRGVELLGYSIDRVATVATLLLASTLMLLGMYVNRRDHFLFWSRGHSNDLGISCKVACVGCTLPTILASVLIALLATSLFVDIHVIISTAFPIIGTICTLWAGFLIVRLLTRVLAVRKAHKLAADQLAKALK